MLPTMLEEDRKRAGWSVGQAAWEVGVTVREYREIEAGERRPNWETFNRICELCGWGGPRRSHPGSAADPGARGRSGVTRRVIGLQQPQPVPL